jgi:tripartite-type tricarboxylate transporter receptor subunit TctC
MPVSIHRLARRTTALMGGLLFSASLLAQSAYPSKPVTLMVPYPAGGVSDVIARTVNNTLSKQLGQPVIVENLGGASGSIAAQKVLSQPSDGHMVFQGSPNELILAPLALSAVKFKSEDFRLVNMIATAQIGFLTRGNLPVNNIDEFVEYARKQAQQGRPITYASVGPGSFYHLLGEHLSKVTGIPMMHVPYKGGGPVMNDLLGNQVDSSFMNINTAMPQILAGKLRPLAITSARRSGLLPNVPTLEESGIKEANVYSWQAIAGPRGLPADIKNRLHAAIASSLNDPQVRPRLLELGFEIVASTPEQFTAYQAAEFARWKRLIESRNIKAD